ncbi:transcriptional regulator, LacI family [Emticicia oligotrophica DSM 17448]|uniref:Transcriptional regulator, LacI family n=1 Tax=Emticicia oligotrophica (strain DSM 17448 / CIP 109782 / MTCC 6937 / GPTSA100-15) TaxID=929562 RepID=A0ABM5N6T8_EMTOG|nr:substrate-binding domain-containing protein [Emticicia oligotrophica]AFK05269.1 transcriptional regulator, LacI family [Emticicia oligotrophica DSM 17448]
MIACTNCGKVETIVKAGFIRGKQRLFCKGCELYFTINPPNAASNKKSHQTTIVDIAKVLGISPSTVSRALNNSSEINENTRQEIIRVANELDYRPNLLAQSLHRGETHTIGVVIPDIQRPFFAGVVAGIQKVASEAGYRVMICQSNESHSTETLNVQALMASRVDGLLISHTKETNSFEHIKLHLKKGVPIVHFDRVCEELETAKVIQEDFEGSFALVEHLIQQGCKRIAACAGPVDLLISQKRMAGYKAALEKYGLTIDQNLIFHSDFKEEDTLSALNQWLEMPNRPDGIFNVHYANAIEMIMALKQKKILIPEEIALAAFGDDLLASMIEPSLTVYNQFPFTIGQEAASILIDNIINKENFVPYTKVIKGKLIVRKSSKKN